MRQASRHVPRHVRPGRLSLALPMLALAGVTALALVPATAPGGTGPLTRVAISDGLARRSSEAVVVSAATLPQWSRLAAVGTAEPYPSGAGEPNPVGDKRRTAHNGTISIPPDARSGVKPSQIVGYAYDAGRKVYREIPVQVDERYPYFLANGRSDFGVYSGTDTEITYAWGGDGRSTDGQESWKRMFGQCTARYAESLAEVNAAVAAGWVTFGPQETAESYLGAQADPVPTLDDDDEIAFMPTDAADKAPGGSYPQGVTQGKRYELRVADPITGDEAFVYLFLRESGPAFNWNNGYVRATRDANADQFIDRGSFADSDKEKLGTSNTGYGGNIPGTVCDSQQGDQPGEVRTSSDRFPRDGITVQTENYVLKATGRWMIRNYHVVNPARTGYGADLIDRWKGRAFQQSPDSTVSLVGFEDEQVNWEANSTLLGWRRGPVRFIREIWGADSGTNVTKTETYYRSADQYRYRVRVHPIPSDGLYTSWDYNPGTAHTYYNALKSEGVRIDGKNDDTGQVDSVPVPYVSPTPGFPSPQPPQQPTPPSQPTPPQPPSPPDPPSCTPDAPPSCETSSSSPTPPAQPSSPSTPNPPAPPTASTPPQPQVYSSPAPAFFDAPDPTFQVPTAVYNYEQVAGKDNTGSVVYVFEFKGATTAANAAVVPYYRDDACLDDGTGDAPVPRPWPGEASTDSRVRNGYVDYWNSYPGSPGNLTYADLGCTGDPADPLWKRAGFQGATGAHGLHFFATQDSDNGFVGPVTINEIDGAQWRFAASMTAPRNVGLEHQMVVVAPLQVVADPLNLNVAPELVPSIGLLEIPLPNIENILFPAPTQTNPTAPPATGTSSPSPSVNPGPTEATCCATPGSTSPSPSPSASSTEPTESTCCSPSPGTGSATPEPTESASLSPSPGPSPSETVSASPEPSTTPTPGETPTPAPSLTPTPDPSTEPTGSPTSVPTGGEPTGGEPTGGSPTQAAPRNPTLSAPTVAFAGVPTLVGGEAEPGAEVAIFAVTAPDASLRFVKAVTTGDNGIWSTTVRPVRNVTLQARTSLAGREQRSGTRFVAVRLTVTQKVNALSGCVVQAAGKVYGPKPGALVHVRAVRSDGRTLELGAPTVQRDGRYLLRTGYPCNQELRVYSVIEGDKVNRVGVSDTTTMTTRRRV